MNKLLLKPQRGIIPYFKNIRKFGGTTSYAEKADLEHSVLNDGKAPLWEVENRTSLVFTLNESPGVLNKALGVLTNNKINMTRIHSKPSKFIDNNWR